MLEVYYDTAVWCCKLINARKLLRVKLNISRSTWSANNCCIRVFRFLHLTLLTVHITYTANMAVGSYVQFNNINTPHVYTGWTLFQGHFQDLHIRMIITCQLLHRHNVWSTDWTVDETVASDCGDNHSSLKANNGTGTYKDDNITMVHFWQPENRWTYSKMSSLCKLPD